MQITTKLKLTVFAESDDSQHLTVFAKQLSNISHTQLPLEYS